MDKGRKQAGKTAEVDKLFRMLDEEGQEEALRMLYGMRRLQKSNSICTVQVKRDSF